MNRRLILLLTFVTALCLFGLLILYSTIYTPTDAHRFHVQAVVLSAGLLLVPLLMIIDYGWLARPPVLWALGAVGLILLIAVFVPGAGVRSHGASRWVRNLGQPSEYAKPILAILLAAALARMRDQDIREFRGGFLNVLLLGAVPALLVFIEPDWGSALLLGALTLGMLLLAGARWLHLIGVAVVMLPLLCLLVMHNQVRLLRILVFLDPEAHRHGLGWQVWQALLAIGGGGLRGHFMDNSLHVFGFVPEQQTDFIFSCVGNETGLWGTTLVLLLYLGIFLCGLRIMQQARDRFGSFLAAGCTIIITLQACLNIAVTTSLVPNKGLPLPFISYGGSDLVASFVCVGLLASVARHLEFNAASRASSPSYISTAFTG